MILRVLRKSPKELYQRVIRRALDELDLIVPSKPSTRFSFAEDLRTPWDSAESIVEAYKKTGTDTAVLVDRAERALSGTLSLLGFEPRNYGTSPDWHFDPVSNLRSPRVPWLRVPYLNADMVGDHKVVWELNRHQGLTWLAQGFVLTGDERYAHAALRLMTHWIQENPVGIGINWVSSLELSIRSIQWTAVLHLLQKSRHATPKTLQPICASLESQILHVRSHLSTWFAPNTHLTAEALGLVVAGTAFPELRGASSHVQVGRDILEAQATRQIRADGGYFEQSSWYQAYTVDIYVEAARWLDVAGQPFDAFTKNRVRTCAEFLRQCCRPDGSLARYGDDDGGSLWRLGTSAFHQGTLTRAASFFDDVSLLAPAQAPELSDLFLNATAFPSSLVSSATALPLSLWVAPQSGLIRIDDRDQSPADMLLLDAGPHGAFGHPHADALSVDLSVCGVPIVVDPGTGSYFGEVRQTLRRTGAHATLEVDGRCTSEAGGPFAWRRTCDAMLVRSGVSTPVAWAEGALLPSADDLRDYEHVRTILRVSTRAWFVLDHVSVGKSTGNRRVVIRWTLAPQIHGVVTPRGVECYRGQDGIATVLTDDPNRTTLTNGIYSPAYGRIGTAHVIAMSADLSTRGDYCTVIGSADAGATLVKDASGLPLWRYRDARGEILVAQPRGVPIPIAGASHDGDWVIVIGEGPRAIVVAAGADSLQPGPGHRLSEMIGDVSRFDAVTTL